MNADKVLVVEDDPDVRAALTRALSFEGYDVAIAEDGGRALEAVRNDPPDVIVLDVMMPFVDGLEACRRLRARGDETPILMLTALGDVVNTASRVESATKEFAANLLVSEAVHGLVSGKVKSGRVLEATLKGKADTHKLFEVLDFAAPRTDADRGAHAARVVLQGITRMDAPGLLRLAFHDAISGGVDGSIRHPEALELPQNRGLEAPLMRLTQLKERLVDISWGDLIALAGAAAVERCGGPHIPLSLGRPEATVAFDPERVPGREEAVGPLLERFAQMGLGARDLVALSGAHTLGKVDESPFTSDPFSFSNSYFKRVLDREDSLLQSDRTLLENPETRACVEEYAHSERAFFVDFVAAYRRMCD